jgi:hypothetical protein
MLLFSLTACGLGSDQSVLQPIAQDGWVYFSPRRYFTQTVVFTSEDSVVRVRGARLRENDWMGPIVPLPVAGSGPIEFNQPSFFVSVQARSRSIEVDLRNLRVIEPCGPDLRHENQTTVTKIGPPVGHPAIIWPTTLAPNGSVEIYLSLEAVGPNISECTLDFSKIMQAPAVPQLHFRFERGTTYGAAP